MIDMRTVIKLEEIAEIGRGSSPRPIGDKKYFKDGTIPWVKIADATASGKYIYETKEHVNDYGASFSRILESGSLIMSSSGVSLGIPKFLGIKGCIHDGWLYFSNIHDIDKEYLYYVLKTMRPYFDNLSYGAAIQNINSDILKKTKLEVPDIKIQKEISLFLSKYDALIENNNKRIKILEQMAEELYKEWFVKMRFPGFGKMNFKREMPKGWVLGEHNVMEIPESWKFGRVGEIGSFARGKNITKDEMVEGRIPVISAGIGPSGYHNESNVRGYSLTMSASGANAGYLNYHLNDIWAADCSYYHKDSNIWFMYNSLNFIRKAIDNLQVGSAQPHVYPKNINKLCILLPEEKNILKFNEYVKPFYENIKVLRSKNENLVKQRDLLLPRLMSGKLEVK